MVETSRRRRCAAPAHGGVGSHRVEGIPEAADEYDTYGGVVGRMFREGTTSDQLETYLADIRKNCMGLGPSSAGQARDRAVSTRLIYASALAEPGARKREVAMPESGNVPLGVRR